MSAVEEQLFVESFASMPCRSNGHGFVFLVIDNPDMSLEARRAVQRNLMRCRFVHGVFGSKVSRLIELIFICTRSLGFAVEYRFCSRHICARQMECEGGFGALILVYAVLM